MQPFAIEPVHHQTIAGAKRGKRLTERRSELETIFQDLPDYLLVGTGAIAATVVLIVFMLMGPLGRHVPKEVEAATQSAAA